MRTMDERIMNFIENIDEFVNKNWRDHMTGSFNPSDAPQDYLTSVQDAMELRLGEISVGATFYYEAYPNSFPGKYFKYEKDKETANGNICTWISKCDKYIINAMEDTYCFSMYKYSTKVWILLDQQQRAFSPKPEAKPEEAFPKIEKNESDDEIMDEAFSIQSFDASLSISNDRIQALEQQVETLVRETQWLKEQLKCTSP